MALAFAGCKKDTSSNKIQEQQNASFVGDWKYTKSFQGSYDAKGAVIFEDNQTSFPKGDHIVYSADGGGHVYADDSEALFTYTYANGVLIETLGSYSVTYKVDITGNKMHRYADFTVSGKRNVIDETFEKK